MDAIELFRSRLLELRRAVEKGDIDTAAKKAGGIQSLVKSVSTPSGRRKSLEAPKIMIVLILSIKKYKNGTIFRIDVELHLS